MEIAVDRFDRFRGLSNFDSLVSMQPSANTPVLHDMEVRLCESMKNESISFELVKEIAENAAFDEEPAARGTFINPLHFEDEASRAISQALQGSNVLAFDDVLTSRATLDELSRCLHKINPSIKLTCLFLFKS